MKLLFRRKAGKWHEGRWFSGDRDIYLALQFGAENNDRPTVERLDSKDASANAAQPPLDETKLIDTIERAVTLYNRQNSCNLNLTGIRYRPKGGADETDHGAAATKLLNLL